MSMVGGAGLPGWQAPQEISHQQTEKWLAQCAAAQAQDPQRRVHPERWLWAEPPVERLRLPLLLVSGHGAEGPNALRGHRAWLTLALLPAAGAKLGVARLPASTLTPVDSQWQAVLDELQAGLQGLLQAQAGTDLAIGWDVCPQTGEDPISALQGRSAAASLTVGALWLVRRWLQPGFSASPLWPLACLSPAELADCWISADVYWAQGQPQLGRVEECGLQAKAQALAKFDATATLHAHQALEGPSGARVKPAQDWADLLKHMGAQQGWSMAQAQLLWALQGQLPHQDQTESLPAEVLQQVAQQEPSRFNHQQAALALFARWEQPDEGPIIAWHVPLDLAPDEPRSLRSNLDEQRTRLREAAMLTMQDDTSHPPGSTGSIQSTPEQPGHRLDEVLKYSHAKEAILLLGGPGAGKTTLMRHRVQVLCWRALYDWHRDQQPEELPLYLPLNKLRADADPVAWAEQYLREVGLASWLPWVFENRQARAEPPPPWLPRSWRWMLDGLNELPYATETREKRAEEVVLALQDALAIPPPLRGLPLEEKPKPVLSIRNQHFRRREWLCMQLQPWRDADIRNYLKLRFPEQGETWHWRELVKQPEALDLVRNPLMLAGLADLLSAEWSQSLPRNRAHLYAAWLWFRLRRALGVGATARTSQQADIESVQAFMRPEDLEAVKDPSFWMEPDNVLKLPLQSPLLMALVHQAETQYWADHAQGKGRESRCKVGVPWWHDNAPPNTHCVSHTLQEHLQLGGLPEEQAKAKAQLWARAVQALGLAVVHTGLRNTFEFSHQSWGEYLASLRLLTPPVNEAEAEIWHQRLFIECSPPETPDPAPELKRRRQILARRWEEVFDLRRRTILSTPGDPEAPDLCVPWSEFCADERLNEMKKPEESRLKTLFKEAGPQRAPLRLVVEKSGLRRVKPDLCLLGEAMGVPSALKSTLGAAPGSWFDLAEGWHEFLVNSSLNAGIRERIWGWLKREGVDERLIEDLKEDGGYLPPLGLGDSHEVLNLALLGAPNQVEWLLKLLTNTSWRAAVPAALALRDTLEPRQLGPEGDEWFAGHWTNPHPLLQFLRKRLLLQSIDAGEHAKPRLDRSGILALLEPDPSARLPLGNGNMKPDQIAKLEKAWRRAWQEAFMSGGGVKLQERLQCAQWLGKLGDNLRFERARRSGAITQRGFLLRSPLWVAVGHAKTSLSYVVGGRSNSANECKASQVSLTGFKLPIYPVTVMEYQCFVRARGYEPTQRWWSDAGRRWLEQHGGRERRPSGWERSELRHPLQPVVGLSWWEAQAFTEWSRTLQPIDYRRHPMEQGQLSLPSELEMQAAARQDGQPLHWQWAYPFNPHELPEGMLPNLVFNHRATRLGQPSPVGVFSLALSQRGTEQCGNVWTWCRNLQVQAYVTDRERENAFREAPSTGPEAREPRALVGGSCHDLADGARVACRCHDDPDNDIITAGLRWVLWPDATK